MAKFIKWVLGIVLVLVLLLVAAVLIAPIILDPNDYKEEIAKAVKDKTGRDLQINQSIKLSLFPWLGLKLGGVTLSNAAGFSDPFFAQIEDLDVKVAIMPLLEKQIVVDTVTLSGLKLNLQQNAQGATNWGDLQQVGEKTAEVETEAKEQAETDSGMELQIQGVKIKDSSVSWRDDKAGEHFLLDDMRLSIGAVGTGKPVPLSGGFKFAAAKQKLELALDISGELNADKALKDISMSDFALKIQAQGGDLPKDGVNISLLGDLDLDLNQQNLQVNNLSFAVNDLQLSGKISATGLDSKPAAKGDIELKPLNLKKLLVDLGVDYATVDPKVLESLGMKLTWEYANNGISLKPLNIKLDDTNLTGFIRVTDFAAPAISFQLDVDDINVDRYLPPASETPEAKPTPSATTGNPFAALKTLVLDGKLTIGHLVAGKANMEKLTVGVKSKNGVLSVNPIKANLYQGTFQGSVNLDARSSVPKYKVSKNLKGIHVGPLLKDLTGEDTLLGVGDVQVNVSTSGLTDKAYRKNLNGNLSLSLKDGAYKGVNIAQSVRQASALQAGGGSSSKEPLQTDFSTLTATATIKNGVMQNNDLNMASPLARIDGKGTVNLNAEEIDYLLTTELVGSLEGQGGKSASDLTGVAIPVRLKGNWTNPKISVDMQAALKANAGKKLEEQKEILKDKAKEKIKEKFGDKLKGFL